MYYLRSQSMSAFCGVCLVTIALGPMLHSPALAETTMQEIAALARRRSLPKTESSSKVLPSIPRGISGS